ncbi:hypothetical protein BN946_scf184325.g14 [Trametes cinnabarina]|uniref:18S rRNA factor 2 n=1 Tax=Pycnoporus cinnabarinus TaxID=5643 RepID=A0A060SJD7_PYCCI|nr:hypothetical protein BN946_scf184325.g14 [Trametes cinnabarina]
MPTTDPRFAALADPEFAQEQKNGEPSCSHSHEVDYSAHSGSEHDGSDEERSQSGSDEEGGERDEHDDESEAKGIGKGMDPSGFAGPSEKVVKPLTPEALAAYKAAQDRAGVIYISRIPPGMRPAKVRHLMSAYGEVGRVYLQQEDPKRAYLRRKYTSTKKAHFTEGWVEFRDKRVARSVAEMLNAQPIGGKKGSRWRDDVWTMKYLPKFKWHMLTEQIAHEAAVRQAQLRVELSQSRKEQREYLKNVELARVLDKRTQRKRKTDDDGEKGSREDQEAETRPQKQLKQDDVPAKSSTKEKRKKPKLAESRLEAAAQLDSVLGSIF